MSRSLPAPAKSTRKPSSSASTEIQTDGVTQFSFSLALAFLVLLSGSVAGHARWRKSCGVRLGRQSEAASRLGERRPVWLRRRTIASWSHQSAVPVARRRRSSSQGKRMAMAESNGSAGKSDSVDLAGEAALVVDISDAISEREKVVPLVKASSVRPSCGCR